MEKTRLRIEKDSKDKFRGSIVKGTIEIYSTLFVFGCISEVLRNLRKVIRENGIRLGSKVSIDMEDCFLSKGKFRRSKGKLDK